MAKKKHCFRIAAALLATSALATPALAEKKDNSVRFATSVTIDNIDPYFNSLHMGSVVAAQIWDTLIYRDPETGAYKGDLATNWKWIDDKTLELELRQGVKFHNGAAFDADDVVYTLSFVTKLANKAVNTTTTRWIDRVEKVDKFRVRIFAKHPYPAAVADLAFPSGVIFPHEYYAKVGPKGMNEHPVGTGPFRVVEHARGKYLRLERNPDQFEGGPKPRPKIDKVEIRFIPDPQTQVAEMVAGGLDLLMNVARDQAKQLRTIPKLQVVSGEAVGYSFLALNTMDKTTAPQLRDIRVRQAIMHAIDRETITKQLIGESARVLHTECFPGQFGCTDQGVTRYDYDPARARKLLAEAGFPNGFDIDIYTAGNRNEVEAIIGYLRAVGINARLRYLQLAAVVSATRAGKVPILQVGWGNTIDDVSNSVSIFHEFGPYDMNRDKEVRDLLVRADSLLDPAARKDAYANAFRLVADRAYVLPLHSTATYYVAAKDLVVQAHTDNVPRFYEMSWK